jgi:hypothetical protein
MLSSFSSYTDICSCMQHALSEASSLAYIHVTKFLGCSLLGILRILGQYMDFGFFYICFIRKYLSQKEKHE